MPLLRCPAIRTFAASARPAAAPLRRAVSARAPASVDLGALGTPTGRRTGAETQHEGGAASTTRVFLAAALAAGTALLTLNYAAGVSTPLSTVEPTQADFEACIAQIQRSLPADCVTRDSEELRAHGIGHWTESPARALPGVVVFPRSTEDVVAIINAARRFRIPIIPYGSGTSIEGSINAPCCGLPQSSRKGKARADDLQPGFSITVNLAAHMNEVVKVHEDDLQVTVQPGVSYDGLNAHLAEMGTGLFFPVDPGPGASIGGMVATGASGTNAVRYGTMRENTLNLTVVLPSGEIIKTRSRAAKSSAGPDLTKLFVGSEGTLGIVVEATIKLAPILPSRVGLLTCDNVSSAASIVAEVLKQGITVQCMELIDGGCLKAYNVQGKKDGLRHLEEKPTLLMKLQGDPSVISKTQARITAIAQRYGCKTILMAKDDAESQQLWAARKNSLNSLLAMRPDLPYSSSDNCVPISKFPVLVKEFAEGLERESFAFSGLVGHAGDGNIHSLILYDGPEEEKAARNLVDRMSRRAIELEGTCAGEHGIGTGKRHLMREELGGSYDLLASIKKMLDPHRIMNPESLFMPDETDE